jgi:hypothetical protein
MTSKLKYAALFFISIGYLLNTVHMDLGPITGNLLMTVGLLLVAAYAVAKFLGK